MLSQDVSIPVDGSQMPAYIAGPDEKSGPHPAVIVLQEVFGLTPEVKRVTDLLANIGYVGAAINYYHRTNPQLNEPYTEEGNRDAFAAAATVPVINGLTRHSHPCQVMADVMTFEEHLGPIRGRTVAWSGDANNVLTSWMQAADRFDFRLRVATPPELAPKKQLSDWAKASGAAIQIGTDPEDAVKGADCVVTDTWVSMGDRNGPRRHNLLKRYQVNARLMARAKPDAIFMHCLPAHRGEEVTDDVIDGPQSVVFDEAENRLHAQKGILTWCLAANGG